MTNDSLIIMNTDDTNQTTVCFRLSESQLKHLDNLSSIEQRSRANMITKIITEYLKKSEA